MHAKGDIINAFSLLVLAQGINTNANTLRSPVTCLCWWHSWTRPPYCLVRNACVINALCCALSMDVIELRWLDIHTSLWTGLYYSIIKDWKVTVFVFCCSACRKGMFIRWSVVGVRLRKDHFVFFFSGDYRGVALRQAIELVIVTLQDFFFSMIKFIMTHRRPTRKLLPRTPQNKEAKFFTSSSFSVCL